MSTTFWDGRLRGVGDLDSASEQRARDRSGSWERRARWQIEPFAKGAICRAPERKKIHWMNRIEEDEQGFLDLYPFNPTTTIQFQIPEASFVTMQIYNITGALVKTMVSENLSTGFYNFVWDGKNNSGQIVSSGIYIYRIQTGDFTDIKRMTFIK